MMRRVIAVLTVFVLGLADCTTQKKVSEEGIIPKAETPAVLMFLENCPIEPVEPTVGAIPLVVAGLLSAAVTTFGPVAFELAAGWVSDA